MVGEALHYDQESLWTGEHDADPRAQAVRFEAVARLMPTSVREVIDVGAGDGRVLKHLQRPGLRPVALDRSRTALRRWDGVAVQAEIHRLPLADRSVDAVLCCEVLEHLPPAVFDAALAELARVAVTALVVTVPNREDRRRNAITCEECGCRYNPDRHLRSFSPSNLVDLFDGFRVAEVLEVGPRQILYPRGLRSWFERSGMLTRPGSPTCPQCGVLYAASSAARGGQTASGDGMVRRSPLNRFLLRRRHPYWLCARFERVSS